MKDLYEARLKGREMASRDKALDLTLAETPQVMHYYDETKQSGEDDDTTLYRTILFAYYAGLAIGAQY